MLIKACLNGEREPGFHPQLPVTPEQLAADAAACAEFGASAVHLHPRNPDGAESLAAEDVAAAVTAVRERCGDLPIGVTTGEWIIPDPTQRLAAIASWERLDQFSRPDFASVDVAEAEWERVVTTLLDAGIGVEAGIAQPSDPPRLAGSGLANHILRVLVESQPVDPDVAVRTADTLLAAITPLTDSTPLVHGREGAAWAVLEWALARELDSRIGLEDTLELPDGNRTPDNAALIAAAYAYLMEPH